MSELPLMAAQGQEGLSLRIAELEAESAELTKALTGLTASGSEFFVRKGDRYVADANACVEYVRRRQRTQHDYIVKATKAQRAAEVERDEALADAERFRALMRCPWISMQGAAGVHPETGERTGGGVHFGAEFWPHPPSPEFVGHYAKSTAWGRACLRALADAILEHEALSKEPR